MNVCRKNGKIRRIEMLKLFSYDYDKCDVATEMWTIYESSKDGY